MGSGALALTWLVGSFTHMDIEVANTIQENKNSATSRTVSVSYTQLMHSCVKKLSGEGYFSLDIIEKYLHPKQSRYNSEYASAYATDHASILPKQHSSHRAN